MSHVMRKPVFRGSDQVRLKLACSASLRLENFGYSNYRYYTIYAANNKDTDQTAWMCRLICIFIVHIWHEQVFS